MSDSIFELTNFKEYLPLEIDISDKDYLHYEPILAPTKFKKFSARDFRTYRNFFEKEYVRCYYIRLPQGTLYF